MIMKKIILIAAVIFVALWACNDEEKVSYYQVPNVSAAEDFVDARDQKVYKCITIGDQIWLAENLAYRVTVGDNNLACRTFEEDYLFMPVDSVEVPLDDCLALLNEDIANGVIVDFPYEIEFAPGFTYPSTVLTDIMGWFTYGFPLNVMISSCESYEKSYGWPTYFREALMRYQEKLALPLIAEIMIAQGQVADRENGHYSDSLGYLYSLEGALAALPAEGGWRLPTDEDWKKLERYLGMAESEVERENDWRGTTEGALLKAGDHGIGFNALFGGGKMYTDGYSNWYDNESFSRKGQNAYFWTSTTRPETDSTDVGVIRSMAVFTDQILRTTTRLVNDDGHPTMFSVRLVKDKE